MLSATPTNQTVRESAIHRWRQPVICCDSIWEENYARFETPEQEIRKFIKRFRQVGARQWPADSRILDLFCGRGNGLKALERDLEKVLSEIHRVLKTDGRFVLIEPWETLFLKMIHWMCEKPILRRVWGKLDALAAMIE